MNLPRGRPVALLCAALLGCSQLPTVDAPDARASADAEPCATPRLVCAGACVDLSRDPAHCGACGQRCPGGLGCVGGACQPAIVQVAAARRHACARDADGAVWCWGDNADGQLGDGTTAARDRPTRVPGLTASAVAVGARHSCAIVAGAGVRCWGANDAHQVSPADRGPRPSPTAVALPSGARALSVGDAHACAALDDGGVVCWPWGASGGPARVAGVAGVTALASGAGHTCALDAGGGVWCFGARARGQLADGEAGPARSDAAVRVAAVAGGRAVAAHANGACALDGAGAVWCWGENALGQCGLGVGLPVITAAARVSDLFVERLWSARDSYFAHNVNGDLFAWGDGRGGILGDGRSVPQRRPIYTYTARSREFRFVTGGEAHLCALYVDGSLRCWGSNDAGAVGNGAAGVDAEAPARLAW